MDNAKFWDGIAEIYDKHAIKKYAQAYADTVELTRKYLKSTDHVLDFACGTGLTTVELAGNVKTMCAVDISPKMIELARDKCKKAGITNVTFSCTTLYDECLEEGVFDVVLVFNALFALPEQEKVFERIGALLKPGGMFLSVTDCLAESSLAHRMSLWMAARLGKVPCENFYTAKSLKNAVSTGGFNIVETYSLYRKPSNLFIAARKI